MSKKPYDSVGGGYLNNINFSLNEIEDGGDSTTAALLHK